MSIFEGTYNNWPNKHSNFGDSLEIERMHKKIKELEWKLNFTEKRNDILVISNIKLREEMQELNKINSRYEILDL